MTAPLVTIAVVPHQRFSFAAQSLGSMLAHAGPSSELIYIDGGSPPLVRQYLEQRAARHGFRLVSTERFVTPNAARNLAAVETRTRYLVFVDNDVLVTPGWLAPLVDCAEATGAWVVGGVCCEGDPTAARIGAAGGPAEILVERGRRVLRAADRFRGKPLAEVHPLLRRETVGQVGLRATLVRRDVFDRLGPLDEGLLSAAEHVDLCLSVQQRGGEVYFEPNSVVTHVPPPPFEPSDLEFFQLRWSDAWNRATIAHLREKWHLADNDPGTAALADELDLHRRLTLEPYRRLLRLFGRRPARWIEQAFIAPIEQAVNRRRFPLAHAASSGELRRAA